MALVEQKQNPWVMHEFASHRIRMRSIDGYFSATDMCKVDKKKLNHYLENKQTKDYVKELAIDLKINDTDKSLIDIKKGGNSQQQGTWIHPCIATHLAMWISPNFSVKVSIWLEEWKLYLEENNTMFMNELCSLQPSLSFQKEKELQSKLKVELNAEIEVETPAGFIDLLTSNRIIELKAVSNWKHALGQILSYSIYYPEKEKFIYLFGDIETDELNLIRGIYNKFNVQLVVLD